MKVITQSAIVLLAPHNNPALINTQFLGEYFPFSLDWEVLSLFESSQRGQVIWKNGLSITSETGRIVFQYDQTYAGPEPYDESCKIGDLALTYLQQISKIKYVALGINFTTVFNNLSGDRNQIFKSSFLSSKWEGIENITPLELKVSRKLSDFQVLNLTINPGNFSKFDKNGNEGEKKDCFLIKGNVHHDISVQTISESCLRAVEIVKDWPEAYSPCSQMVDEVINKLIVKANA